MKKPIFVICYLLLKIVEAVSKVKANEKHLPDNIATEPVIQFDGKFKKNLTL